MKLDLASLASESLAILSSRVTLHPSAADYWQAEALRRAKSCRDAEELAAALLVEYVSRAVAKSIETADARQLADGSRIVDGAIVAPAKNRKSGQRRAVQLSETDWQEIRGEVATVLAFQGAFSRPLASADWLACFRSCQGTRCLDLNRKWKPCRDGEATLAALAVPSFDLEAEAARLEKLAPKVAHARRCIEATFRADKSRKRAATRAAMLATLEALANGETISGRGVVKSAD